MEYEKGIEMFLTYLLCFFYVSRAFGVEFGHQHFTPYYFGAGVIRYLYYHYARTYCRQAKNILYQLAIELWKLCLSMERRTVFMIAILITATFLTVLLRWDRGRTPLRRDMGMRKMELSN